MSFIPIPNQNIKESLPNRQIPVNSVAILNNKFHTNMKTRIMLILMVVTMMTSKTLAAETQTERDERMQWWREARFGMFVHWGLYSGLAGTWDGKPVGTRGGMEWILQGCARIAHGSTEKDRAAGERSNGGQGYWYCGPSRC